MVMSGNSGRLEREKQFHNDYSSRSKARVNQGKYYAVRIMATERLRHLVALHSLQKDILEVGCSQGQNAPHFSVGAQSYTGIDISDAAIEKAGAMAQAAGLKNCRFMAADACAMPFPAAFFDMVIAVGVIHHLPMGSAFHEIRRIVKPGGKVFLVEPLGENPALRLYRKLTPHARTP